MLTLDSGLAQHLQGASTTLARIWRLTRTDAQVFRFAEFDRDIVMPGDGTYLAAGAFTASSATAAEGLAPANLEASSVFSSELITVADLEAGMWDHARVRCWMVNWADPSAGRVPLPAGRLGQVTYDGTTFRAELLALTSQLQTQVGRQIAPGCDAELGDARCGVTLGSFTHALTVTAVTDRATFRDTGLAGGGTPAEYFNFGTLTWLTGANAGRSMEIKSHDADGDFVLMLPMVDAIAVGDTATAIAGCDKSFSQCEARFGNHINFRGYPLLPGMDRIVQTIAL